jgi:hypothetical protein
LLGLNPRRKALRIWRRILITVVVTLAVVFVGVNWIAPVAFSFHAARTAPPVARVVPTGLKDQSVSQAPGEKLLYFGYEFEVPWSDLDETQSKLYPEDKPQKCKVDLHFRSGLRLVVTAVPPREWANGLAKEMKASPQKIDATFGESDYRFAKTIYDFTPDKMSHWAMDQRLYLREQFLLIIKSVALVKSADTGIFNVQNQNFKGFQEGSPQVRQDEIAVQLFSDEGSMEFIFLQKDYQSSAGVTQPEINRIVQSLRRTTQDVPTAPRTAKR